MGCPPRTGDGCDPGNRRKGGYEFALRLPPTVFDAVLWISRDGESTELRIFERSESQDQPCGKQVELPHLLRFADESPSPQALCRPRRRTRERRECRDHTAYETPSPGSSPAAKKFLSGPNTSHRSVQRHR